MAKFELYDKVELNKDLEFYELLEGEPCMIMSDLREDGLYAVVFDFEDEEILHDCDGLVPSCRGLFVKENDLRKAW